MIILGTSSAGFLVFASTNLMMKRLDQDIRLHGQPDSFFFWKTSTVRTSTVRTSTVRTVRFFFRNSITFLQRTFMENKQCIWARLVGGWVFRFVSINSNVDDKPCCRRVMRNCVNNSKCFLTENHYRLKRLSVVVSSTKTHYARLLSAILNCRNVSIRTCTTNTIYIKATQPVL